MEKWMEDVILKMRIHKIRQITLSKEVGCSNTWLSYIFNGKRKCSDDMKKRIEVAVDKIINKEKRKGD